MKINAARVERTLAAAYQNWDFLYRHPAFTIEKSAQRLAKEWFGRMKWIVQSFDGDICKQMVYSERHNLFIAIEQRIAQLFPPEVHDEKSAVWSIPDRLNALLDQHIHHERSVKFYASELCLSPDYLNKVCHRLMKTSTKALINDRLQERESGDADGEGVRKVFTSSRCS